MLNAAHQRVLDAAIATRVAIEKFPEPSGWRLCGPDGAASLVNELERGVSNLQTAITEAEFAYQAFDGTNLAKAFSFAQKAADSLYLEGYGNANVTLQTDRVIGPGKEIRDNLDKAIKLLEQE